MAGFTALDIRQGVELLRASSSPRLHAKGLRKRQRLLCMSQQSDSLTLSW